jgi:hypothetical protein
VSTRWLARRTDAYCRPSDYPSNVDPGAAAIGQVRREDLALAAGEDGLT